jgi:hypothetical protein
MVSLAVGDAFCRRSCLSVAILTAWLLTVCYLFCLPPFLLPVVQFCMSSIIALCSADDIISGCSSYSSACCHPYCLLIHVCLPPPLLNVSQVCLPLSLLLFIQVCLSTPLLPVLYSACRHPFCLFSSSACNPHNYLFFSSRRQCTLLITPCHQPVTPHLISLTSSIRTSTMMKLQTQIVPDNT